jgi:hypothetical protein
MEAQQISNTQNLSMKAQQISNTRYQKAVKWTREHPGQTGIGVAVGLLCIGIIIFMILSAMGMFKSKPKEGTSCDPTKELDNVKSYKIDKGECVIDTCEDGYSLSDDGACVEDAGTDYDRDRGEGRDTDTDTDAGTDGDGDGDEIVAIEDAIVTEFRKASPAIKNLDGVNISYFGGGNIVKLGIENYIDTLDDEQKAAFGNYADVTFSVENSKEDNTIKKFYFFRTKAGSFTSFSPPDDTELVFSTMFKLVPLEGYENLVSIISKDNYQLKYNETTRMIELLPEAEHVTEYTDLAFFEKDMETKTLYPVKKASLE